MINLFFEGISILLLAEFNFFLISSVLFFYFFSFFKLKKIIFKNIFYFFIPIFYLFYNYSMLPEFFSSLGQDTFFELKADLGESIFYLKTLIMFLFDLSIFEKKRFWLVLLSSISSGYILYLIIFYFINKFKFSFQTTNKILKFSYFVVIILTVMNISFIFHKNYQIGKDLRQQVINHKDKINEEIKKINIIKEKNQKHLLLVNYIGESTGAINLSLYGYPFKTTPNLDILEKKDNFILFNNMYSRYVQTTFSLIDSLAICTDNEKYCTTSNFLPIIDILKKAKINTYLYSSQGSLGGHNLATQTVIDAKYKIFSASKRDILKGFDFIPLKQDKEFFLEEFCTNNQIFKNNNDDVVFLHSYAGHGAFGGYLKLIEKKNEFIYPNYINKKNFLGSDGKNFKLTREYDSAIEYIDNSVNTILECSINNSAVNDKPMIFIYFSDHGESSFTARQHDPSRLTYEMLHVPFFIYFNNKAIKEFNTEYNFLKSLRSKNLSLKILNDIFFDLFNLKIIDEKSNKILFEGTNYKNLNTKNLGHRKLSDGYILEKPTLWNVKYKKGLLEKIFTKEVLVSQDIGITNWKINNYLSFNKITDNTNIEKLICQKTANSLILQLKSSASLNCFEVSINFSKNRANILDSNGININLTLGNFLDSNYKKNTVWIVAKNINSVNGCNDALNWIQKNNLSFESILIEIPNRKLDFVKTDKDWTNCLKKINSIKNTEIAFELTQYNFEEFLNNKDYFISNEFKSLVISYKRGLESLITKNKFSESFKWHLKNFENISDFEKVIDTINLGAFTFRNNKDLNNLN